MAEQQEKTKWLSISEARNRMQFKRGNFIGFNVVKNRMGVLTEGESCFMEIVYPPKDWPKPYGNKIINNYSMKVILMEHTFDTKQWVYDTEEITLGLSSSDFKYLTETLKQKLVRGDRIEMRGAIGKTPVDPRTGVGGFKCQLRKWFVSKRAEGNSQANSEQKTNYQQQNDEIDPRTYENKSIPAKEEELQVSYEDVEL